MPALQDQQLLPKARILRHQQSFWLEHRYNRQCHPSNHMPSRSCSCDREFSMESNPIEGRQI